MHDRLHRIALIAVLTALVGIVAAMLLDPDTAPRPLARAQVGALPTQSASAPVVAHQ